MRIKNLLLLLAAVSCAQGHKRYTTEFPFTEKYAQIEVIGESRDPRLRELSGLALSKANKGFLWAHNDSGDEPRVFLIDQQGNTHLTVYLSNAKHIDWEDITIGEMGNKTMIFVGDIGDNRAERDNIQIYAFEEPVLYSLNSEIFEAEAERMNITYDEGARDAETLFFDHLYKELILITKREEKVTVHSFAFKPETSAVSISSTVKLPITQITAGDANTQGEILLKNYNEIYLIENRKKRPLFEILTEPEILRVKYQEEKQGEAICWDETGEGFYVLSEWNDNEPQPFYYYHD